MIESKIVEVLNLALEANNKSKDYHVFFNFAGHVKMIDFRVTEKPDYDVWVYSQDLWFDEDKGSNHVKIEKWLELLKSIIDGTAKLEPIKRLGK